MTGLWFCAALLFAALVLRPACAHADDVDDFLFAVSAFQNGDYDIAIARFQPLVGQDPPSLRASLVEPALRYYAASLVSARREPEAVEVIRRIFRANPDAQFPARDFSPGFIQLAQATRAAMAQELAQVRQRNEEQQRAERARREAARQQFLDLASTERVVVRSTRWQTLLPLGLAQFANGDIAWGVLFAALETGSAVAAGVSTSVVLSDACSGLRDGMSHCAGLFVLNFTSWAVLGLAFAGGVVQANLALHTERVEYRRRPVPPEVRDLHLAVVPLSDNRGLLLSASLRF